MDKNTARYLIQKGEELDDIRELNPYLISHTSSWNTKKNDVKSTSSRIGLLLLVAVCMSMSFRTELAFAKYAEDLHIHFDAIQRNLAVCLDCDDSKV